MGLKVLLVDDEYIVLKGLEIMLGEQKEIALEIMTAMDAVDAMEKLADWCPDVIIADINMPEIDGLTMLEQISGAHPQCRFIIVSGYEDQEYLKRALKLHVADYLTKPVDKAYLIRRLKGIGEEKQAQIKNMLLKIRLMLFSGGQFQEQDLTRDEIKRLFPNPWFALCAAGIPSFEAEKLQPGIAAYFDNCYVFSHNNWSVFLLNYSVRIGVKELRTLLQRTFAGMACGISLFSEEEGIQNIFLPYQRALCDLVLSFLPAEAAVRERIAVRISEHTLQPAIRVLMFEYSITDYINEVCNPDWDIILIFLLVFTEALAANILIAGISLSPETIRQLYQQQAETVHDKRTLCAFMEKSLNFWYDSFTPAEQEQYSSKIAMACEYMEMHYEQDIALEQVAEYISINPSYLSYIFKKETGSTFLQYLTNIRLQKACRLMTDNPELSLDDVAAKTGYHSTSYFHKIFRSRFGMSPRQWLQRGHRHT